MSRAGTEGLVRRRRTKAEMAAVRAFEAEQDAAHNQSNANAVSDLALMCSNEFHDVAGANVGLIDQAGAMTEAAAREKMGVPSKPLGRVAFMHAMTEFIKRLDTAKAHKAARDLEVRIESGEDKIKAAMGKAPLDALAAANLKLNDLKAELLALRRDYIVPHYMIATLHSLLDTNDRQGWPITSPGVISINLPGVFSMAVEVPTGLPF